MWVKERCTGLDFSEKRRVLQANTRESDPDNPSEKEAVKLLNEAQRHLRKVRMKAKELREEFLIKRAEMYTDLGEMSKAKK